MKFLKFSLLLLIPSLLYSFGQSVDIEIEEWLVPWSGSRPRDPYVDSLNRVWFCGQSGNYIAYLEPNTGEFQRYELETGTHPHNLIVDDEGFIWYAGNRNAHIGKLDPETGHITKFSMPDRSATDPHTLVFGTEGDIWFTLQQSNFIGKLDMATGQTQLIKVPTSRARPYGIKRTVDNRPWIVLLGTNKLATIDPKTLTLEEIDLPRAATRPRRLEITTDGKVWYVDYNEGYLGSYNPENQEFKEWIMPSGKTSRPYGTARDAKDRIWIAETGPLPNRLVGFDPKTEEFFAMKSVPSGGSIRHMYYHKTTNEIWFGTDTNYIGKIIVP